VSSDLAAIASVEVPTRLAAVRLSPGLEDGVELGPLVNAVKQSGIGREGGYDGLLEFTETKYVAVDW
jgi:succinate-semialdehyde dehydrogenase/glutarate-semialdehyde dehydrogenase